MIQRVKDILANKSSVTLEDLKGDVLFLRKDNKFLARLDKLEEVLLALDDNWKVLDVKGVRNQRYHSNYLDTADYDCYNQHHNERKNRKKFRFRRYGDSDTVFFEVKTKTNKGITAKERIPVKDNSITKEVQSFIEINSEYASEEMRPTLNVDYSRMTFLNDVTKEKITIDTDLLLYTTEERIKFNNILILELKQDYYNRYLPTRRMMQDLDLVSTSLSKYCLGISQCVDLVKKNKFKQKTRMINKLEL